MKKWLFALFFAALPLSAQTVRDGGFDEGLTYWKPNAPAKIAIASDATSPKFLRMTYDSATPVLFVTQELTPVEPGVHYTLGANLRLGAPSAPTLLGSVIIEYLDAAGARAGYHSEPVETTIPGTTWLYVSTTLRAPQNAVKLRAWLRVDKKPNDTTPTPWQSVVDFDDVVLTRQVPSTSTLQTRPSMLAADGHFLYGGQPYFPIGIYSLPPVSDATIGTRPELFAALRAHGFNAVRPKAGDVNTALRELKSAQEAGLTTNFALFVPEEAQGGIRYSVLDTLVRSRWSSALLAWNTADEPDMYGDAPEAGLELAYREYRRIDGKQRPVLLTLTRNTTYWANYLDAADATVATDYPRPWGFITDPHDTAVRLRQQHGRKAWQHTGMVIPLGWSPYPGDWGYAPTYAQARAMAYGAVIGGAQSIWWYALHVNAVSSSTGVPYKWYATESELWPSIKKINEELGRIAMPLLVGTRQAITVAEAPSSQNGTRFKMLSAGIRHLHGDELRFYVVASNVTPQSNTIPLDDTNRCLGSGNNHPAAATATFTIPGKVLALAEPADYVTWTYDAYAHTTTITAAFAPLESRTIVLKLDPAPPTGELEP